jgi:predicted nucleic acid-binding protein
MRTVFADANYWIALLNPKDELHANARKVSEALGSVYIVTSEMVLTEVLNGLADKGGPIRGAAVALVDRLRNDPNADVVPQTSIRFEDATKLYGDRPDKHWSLVDCSSILLMQEKKLTDALTYDEHFVQAGFKALLRD